MLIEDCKKARTWVEYCVDDGVEAGVDVAEEGSGLECHVTRRRVQRVLDAESVQNIAGEEGNPANKETH